MIMLVLPLVAENWERTVNWSAQPLTQRRMLPQWQVLRLIQTMKE